MKLLIKTNIKKKCQIKKKRKESKISERWKLHYKQTIFEDLSKYQRTKINSLIINKMLILDNK